MRGFASISHLADCDAAGRTSFCSFRKVPSQASVAGNWVDISMAAGNPLPNFYAASPLVATVLDPFRGLFHGDAKAPAGMYLTELGIVTPTAACLGRYELLDYLLFYPFIDGDSLDEQAMDNTVPLPRYTGGGNVRAMLVAVAPTAGGGTLTYAYRNQAGDLKTSPVVQINTTPANIATLLTSQQGVANCGAPYLPLADGDTDVLSVESVTFIAPMGGLAALVLVRPLASTAAYEVSVTNELQLVRMKPGAPQVLDGAYLNFIANPAGSVAGGAISGHARFAWST
jgi:hypothetical protein